MLTDVRFKLAAFVPALTGAAVALLTKSSLPWWSQSALALGGLVFVLGIVLYDLRNSQHYNSAVGRAEMLEQRLYLDTAEEDTHPGLFGSRNDTSRRMAESDRDWMFGILPVKHTPALAFIYSATLGAWLWSLLRSFAVGFEEPDGWFGRKAPRPEWAAIVLTIVGTLLFFRELLRLDGFEWKPKETATDGKGSTAPAASANPPAAAAQPPGRTGALPPPPPSPPEG